MLFHSHRRRCLPHRLSIRHCVTIGLASTFLFSASLGNPASLIAAPQGESDLPPAVGTPGLALAPIVANSDTPPRPGCWWSIPLTLSNSASVPKTAKLSSMIRGDAQAQFTKLVEVPPTSTIKEDLWVKLPDVPAETPVFIITTFKEVIDGKEVTLTSDGARMEQESRVLTVGEPVTSAIVMDVPPIEAKKWEWRTDTRHHSYELAIACRQSDRLPRMMVDMTTLPEDIRAWDAIDNIFINSVAGLNDPAGLAAMRQWLTRGGKAWIALDRVGIDAVRPLLGDVWRATDLGMTELTEFDIRTRLRPDMSAEPRRVEQYLPVRVLRLQQEGGDVTHHIDQWPAAIRVAIGRGEVWLTTVAASAWYRKTNLEYDPLWSQEYEPNDWAIPIVSSFQQPRQRDRPTFLTAAAASSYVGYEVPSRAAVFGSLSFFVLASILAGILLWRRGRLEWTGWAVPAIALLSATPLFATARSSRSSVPDTVANVQFADLQTASGQAVVDQQSVIYLGQPRAVKFDVPADAAINPFVGSSTVSPYNLEADTTGNAVLNIAQWPTGLQPVQSQFTATTGSAEAIGTFNATGLTIDLPDSLPGNLTDPLFVAPPTRASVPLLDAAGGDPAGRGRYSITAALPTSPEVRLGSGLLDQAQQHHQDVYRELLADPAGPASVSHPSILVWSDPWPSPIDGNNGISVKGEALNRLDLRLIAAKPGSKIAIPANILTVTSLDAGIADSVTSVIANGQVHPPLQNAKTWRLKWQLPDAALPLNLETVQFTVQLKTPLRTVTISAVGADENGTSQTLGTYTNAVQTVTIDIDPQQIPYEAREGTIVLEFAVSDMIREESTAPDPAAANPDGPIIAQPPQDEPDWQVLRPEMIVTGTVGG